MTPGEKTCKNNQAKQADNCKDTKVKTSCPLAKAKGKDEKPAFKAAPGKSLPEKTKPV